ncbi:MAG: FG-GAP-like repeat-containing protein, partial [Gemmatimonadales bacterium]
VWNCTVPEEGRRMAREDSVPYENDGIHVSFPHMYGADRGASDGDEQERFMEWFRGTPMHDEAILGLARRAIDSLQMGQRGPTDFLGVNLSSLDDAGHTYGPWSLEQLDALLRLDHALGEFFAFIDSTVGESDYVVALAGDHGVADAPAYRAAQGERGRRITPEEMETLFDSVLAVAEPGSRYSEEVANRVAAVVEQFDFIADAMTHTELSAPEPADSFVALYRNSYRSDRRPWFPLRSVSRRIALDQFGVVARLEPWAMVDYATAIHGSPYDHDRRVGLVFMGAGVRRGTSASPVRSVDVAPTLASLAGIPIPAHVDGVSLFCTQCEQAGGEMRLFEAVRDGEMVTDGGLSRGVAWGDYDNDGDPDLVVANTINWPQFVYRNDGGGAFTEIHEVPITLAVGWTEGVQWIDYDNDGDLDLYQTNTRNEPNGLFSNDGSGEFTRVEAGALTGDSASSTMSCWADYDLDGDVDAFVVNRDGQPDALYRNEGAEFERLSGLAPVTDRGNGRACTWIDADDDGDVDLYVGNADERNYFYRNDGAGRFSEVTAGDFVTAVAYTYGVSAADYDADGDADLFVSNVNETNVLYRNDGNLQFSRMTDGPVVSDGGGASKGNTWGDFDNDGDLDLFVANGTYRSDMRNFLYLNDGNSGFVRLNRGPIALDADTSAGAAWADYDMDGDLDLFVANWGGSDEDNALYANTTSGRSWVSIRTIGNASNRQGVGAKVRLKAVINGRAYWQTRWALPHTGYASQNTHQIHFGLGDATQIDSLEISWPLGLVDTYTRVEPDRFLVATEGEGLKVASFPYRRSH